MNRLPNHNIPRGVYSPKIRSLFHGRAQANLPLAFRMAPHHASVEFPNLLHVGINITCGHDGRAGK